MAVEYVNCLVPKCCLANRSCNKMDVTRLDTQMPTHRQLGYDTTKTKQIHAEMNWEASSTPPKNISKSTKHLWPVYWIPFAESSLWQNHRTTILTHDSPNRMWPHGPSGDARLLKQWAPRFAPAWRPAIWKWWPNMSHEIFGQPIFKQTHVSKPQAVARFSLKLVAIAMNWDHHLRIIS